MDSHFRAFRVKLVFIIFCTLCLFIIKGHISLGYVPKIEKKSIAVTFDYYGSFEREVEVLVSRLEEAYMELDGIKNISSVSEAGKGYILCLFSDKTCLDDVYMQISDITSYVWSDFPDGVNRPSIIRSSQDAYPVYISYFSQEKEEDADLIKKAYEAVSEVGEVEIGGRKKKELVVELHNGQLTGMTLSGDSLGIGIQNRNIARKVVIPGGQTFVLSSRLSSISDFEQIHINPSLRLSDVADIKYVETASQSLGHIDGKPALIFFIMKAGDGNTVRLCRNLEKVTSRFGGSRFYSLGNEIEISFIVSFSILILMLFFLLFDLWLRTKNWHFVVPTICRYIAAALFAITSVSVAGLQVDMTVMAALFAVIILSAESNIQIKYDALYHNSEPISSRDIATLRSIGRKSINDFTSEDIEKADKWAYKFWKQLGIKSPFFRKMFGDWREFDISKVEALPKIKTIDVKDKDEAVVYIKLKIKDGTLYRDDKTNKDTGLNINIGKLVYDDSLKYAGRKFSRKKEFMQYLALISVLSQLDIIVEKSILFDTQTIDNNKNSYRSFMHKFYTFVNIQGDDYLIKLAVDELNSEKGDIYRAYNVNGIKITPANGITVYKPTCLAGAGGSNTSTFTVADLHALVKQYDKAFHPLPSTTQGRKTNFKKKLFFSIFFTLIVALYAPVGIQNLILPSCIALTSGLGAYAVSRFLVKETQIIGTRASIWCFTPVILFVLFLVSHSPFSPFASDVSFSLEYESGTSFSFVEKSALDIESELLQWNSFDQLTLHVDQDRASFTVLGGRKSDIMHKINELSKRYPEIFFYIPEKHTRHSVDVIVYGNDVTEIKNNVLQLAKYVNNYSNKVNIIYNFKSDVINIVLEIPVKCVSSGLYPYDVYKSLYYTVSEPVVDKFYSDGIETDVKICGDTKYRETLAGLLSTPVLSPFGIAGEAGDYIRVRKESGQGRIYHRNRMRVLSFSVTGVSRRNLRKLVSGFQFSGSCHGEVL